jgi:hypothetical protein
VKKSASDKRRRNKKINLREERELNLRELKNERKVQEKCVF